MSKEFFGASHVPLSPAVSDVIKTTVWLRDRDDFASFNEAYAEFFPENPPARSTAESRLMIDIAVEIEAIAYKPL
jgi:enamine deaminase RidA (YjgF/YER057c/UK114 family)